MFITSNYSTPLKIYQIPEGIISFQIIFLIYWVIHLERDDLQPKCNFCHCVV